MKTAVVLNALLDGSSWAEPIKGQDPIEEVLKKASLFANKEGVFVLVKKQMQAGLEKRLKGCHLIRTEDMSARNVFGLIRERCARYGNIVYWYADAPLIDIEITRKMLLIR